MKKQQQKNLIIVIVVAIVVIVGIIAAVLLTGNDDSTHTTKKDNNSTSATKDEKKETTYTPEALDETLTYYADIEVSDFGKITIQLDQKNAPITSANFVALANEGFYNGLTFHRIIEGFMMQGGDPIGNGTGGSGKNIVGEFTQNGYDNKLSHTRGAVSMARSQIFNSASSQFFIVHEDSIYLDGQYAVFGYVTEGMEVVDAVCQAAQPIDDNGTIVAEEQPVITSVTIRTE